MNEKHTITIGVDQYLSNSAMYEHRCLKILKSYTNMLEHVTTKNSTRKLLKQQWSLLLRDLL